VKTIVIIFVFVFSLCVCGETGNDIVLKSIGGLENIPVLSMYNKWFILYQCHPVFNSKSHLLDRYM